MSKRPRSRRNVKVNGGGFTLHKPLISLILGLGFFALTYLFMDGRCEAMSRRIQGLERELNDLSLRTNNEEYNWWKLTSPEGMEAALRRCNLDMRWPGSRRVVELTMVPTTPAPVSRSLVMAQIGSDERNE